tara:strand:+ start:278 stop:886 length:609 start_codon:yes stop_codon:yes gene_type:complete
MRKLTDVPNIEPVTADYPKGRLRDKVGAVPGTTLVESLNGDATQLFQKLVIDAGITENDTPDNVSNGYQLLDALVSKINEQTLLASNEVLLNGGMTTSEKDIVSFTPSATKGGVLTKVTFSVRMSHQNSGTNNQMSFKLYNDGVLVQTAALTNFNDGRNEMISFSYVINYVKNTVVKVTGTTSGNICTVSIPSLFCESAKTN